MSQQSDEIVRRVYAEEWVHAALDSSIPPTVVTSIATRETARRTGVTPERIRKVADQPETRALLVPQRRERVS